MLQDIEQGYAPRHIVAVLVMALVAIGSGLLWATRNLDQQPSASVEIAKPAPEVAQAPTVAVDVKKPVKVYGAAVKNRLELPRPVIDNPSEHVIASSKIDQRDDHPRTVTTVINADTGQSETYVRTDPLPWIAFDKRGGAGMYVGVKNGSPTVRLEAHQELFDIKSVHFGIAASVDQSQNGRNDAFIGIGGEYRW